MSEHRPALEHIQAYADHLRLEEKSAATVEKYLRDVRAFARWLEGREITKERTAAWKTHLVERGYAPASVNAMLSALNSLLDFLGFGDCRVKFLKVQRRMFRDDSRDLTRSDYNALTAAAKAQNKTRLALLMEAICATGIRVGGKSQHRHALQVAGERDFRDFREDNVLDQRSFQLAFRRLRQMTTRQDGPMDVLNLDRTIDETCNNAGYLQLEFDRPRTNDIKVMVLFDSGGSMTPYARLCSQLFQAVNRANNFKDLKIFYFHNCWYSELYTGPRCVYGESVQTQWVINNLSRDYKVIVVGDASMAPSELTWVGGSSYYNRYNAETGLTWLNRFHSRFEKMVWFNPIPEAMWEYDYGYQTIEMIRNTVDMYQLTVEGLGRGLKKLVSAR